MKLVTTRPFNFTALYSAFETITDGDAEKKVFLKPVKIKCAVVANAVGELTIYTDAQLLNGGGIGLVANKQQQLLYPIGTITGAVWRVIEGQPLTDSWGNKNRYRYRCLMVVPQQGSVTEATPGEWNQETWWKV